MKYFSPRKKWLWDSWFVVNKDKYHVFYLQSKKFKNSERRHDYSSIGHAVSKDLKSWEEIGLALGKGEKDSWDDLALWTGSVIKKDGRWYMFYTGRGKKDRLVQKIGLAISDDLVSWEKVDNFVLEVDGRYYQKDFGINNLGKIGAWRDPFVFRKGKKYYMTLSARARGKDKEYNGCIGLAVSEDLINWKIRKPIFSPGLYDEMEVNQVIYRGGFYYLFFGVAFDNLYSVENSKRKSSKGLHCYYSKRLRGPYSPVNGNGVVVDGADKIYDIRLVKKGREYYGIGWLNRDDNGKFVGKLSSKFLISINKDRVIVEDGK
jgi:beta-fructofuranosidase